MAKKKISEADAEVIKDAIIDALEGNNVETIEVVEAEVVEAEVVTENETPGHKTRAFRG
jgi:hypothetical protein